MTETEKQIRYAEALKAQVINEFTEEINGLTRMVNQYTDRQSATGRDYSEKIRAKQERIEKLQSKIDALNSIENAGELIDAIKYKRASIFSR